jgi:hypothetical protein
MRWRVVRPEDAGIGAVPVSAAKVASVRNRPGLGPGDQQLDGADGADAGLAGQVGHPGADQVAQVAEAGGQIGVQAGDLAQRAAQVLLADRLAGGRAQGQGDADRPGCGVAAELGAQVVGRGEDQRLEGVVGGGAGFGGVLTGGEQDPQRLAGIAGARPGRVGGGQGPGGRRGRRRSRRTFRRGGGRAGAGQPR